MRFISLFSGIEAASVAWRDLDMTPLAFSEIEPFPCAVLAHHYPDVPNLGDITTIDWSSYRGQCDLIIGGSPCQSFSIAGSRTGLDGASGLMWEYVRAVREIMPAWVVWENVPGALSSGPSKGEKGEDFGCLLRSLDDLGYGLAWRVCDAQFWGVAQRRRRVFLVGHLGDQRAADVLFESDCLRWDYQTGRKEREAITARVGGGASPSDGYILNTGCTPNSTSQGDPIHDGLDVAQTLGTACGRQVAICIQGNVIGRADCNGPQGCGFDNDLAFTLTSTDRHAVAHMPDGDTYIVRKLTPTECERLMGFPDGYTDIPYKNKEHPADGARYKALGNSFAVPVVRWIGERILAFSE